jgi:imidazolonepropionase-like amidohydrolase
MKKLKKSTLIFLATVFSLISLFVIGVLWPLDTIKPVVTDSPIAIIDTSVLDVSTGKIIANRTVLIKDRKIQAVGHPEEVSIPKDAIYIDGRNRFLMPSLWDMHTHIFKITPMLDMPLYIGYGVTNVRDMTSCPKVNDPFVPCPDDLRGWTKAAVDGQLVAPRIQGVASWHLNGPSVHKRIKGLPEFFGTADAQQARKFVRYYEGKVDAIKVYNYIPRDAYLALVDEAKKIGMDVIGHRPHAVSAIEAASHQKSIEHARFILHESFKGREELRKLAEKDGMWYEDRRRMLDEHDPVMANAIFEAMKASGAWYVPTHLTRRADAYGDDPLVLEDPLLRYLHPLIKFQWLEDINNVIDEDPSPEARKTYRDFYQKGLELTGKAHQAGVKVLVGSDYIVAGATVHDELLQLVLAGLTPAEALRAATLSPAEYFGLENQYGRVAEGMIADVILLNENPFEDISHSRSIESVIFNGNLYGQKDLQNIYEHVEGKAKSWTVACKILWEFIKNPVSY